MTLFTEPETPGIDQTKNYLQDLVGEGKKFKDSEALAKGKLESDQFIERLKAEQAELRKELDTRIKYEEFLAKLETAEKPSGTPGIQTPSEPVVPPVVNTNTEEDLSTKVDAIVAKREALQKQAANLDQVKQELIKKFGPNYAQTIAGQAKVLGLSQKELDGMAAQSPKAFLKLFGAEDKKIETFNPPKTQVNAQTFTPASGEQKTMKYYRELKAKDPRAFFDPTIANEMHDQAKRLGEAFFD